MLRIENLHVEYAGIPALRGIDIDIRPGEIVALIGANGAGKSTTLKAISGLVRPSAGKIEFDGKPVAGLAPEALVELGIIHVPEGRRVFPRLTVRKTSRSDRTRRARGQAKGKRASRSIASFQGWRNDAGSQVVRSAAANSRCWHLAAR